MSEHEFMNTIFSAMVNQAIQNREKWVNPLPQDQEEAQRKILDAIHDIVENRAKIKPEYQTQVLEAAVLKIAAETNWFNGGNRR